VYSAGVVLYELLTGVPPYDGEHALAVAYQHVNQDVPPPSARVPGVPPDLDALVISATRRDPEARPPSAEVLLHAVRGVRASLGIPRVPVPVPGGPPAPRTASSTAPSQTRGPRHAAPVGAASQSFARPPGGLSAGPARFAGPAGRLAADPPAHPGNDLADLGDLGLPLPAWLRRGLGGP
jgi:serine/threonine-protein kinase